MKQHVTVENPLDQDEEHHQPPGQLQAPDGQHRQGYEYRRQEV
jgi:hypothetical protein